MVWLQYVFSCDGSIRPNEQIASYNQASYICTASPLYEYADGLSNETILYTPLYTLKSNVIISEKP